VRAMSAAVGPLPGREDRRPRAGALPVGDPRRAPAGRAALASLVTVAAFLAFAWGSKEVRALGDHAPWQNDPYDAFVSFALFFLPFAGALLVLRVLRCRRFEPLPAARLVGVLRASGVALAIVAVTLTADWAAVVAGADAASWTTTTIWLVAALGGVTALTLVAARLAWLASRQTSSLDARAGSDALGEAVALLRELASRLGPLEHPVAGSADWFERAIAVRIRRHPLAWAALASLAFGFGIGALMAREEGVAPIVALIVVVAGCGMFAFLATAGSYLGLVHPERPLLGARRRLADACVAAAAAVPIALGFRSSLWWLVGGTEATAGVAELTRLVAVVAVAVFAGVAAVETAAGIHDDPSGTP